MRKSYKIVSKRSDHLSDIHVHEAQENKKEETIIMMIGIIREDQKIEKTRKKTERMKREIDEDYQKHWGFYLILYNLSQFIFYCNYIDKVIDY